MSDCKRKALDSHYDAGNKRRDTHTSTCNMITNMFFGWIEVVGNAVSSLIPGNDYRNSAAGPADAPATLRENTPIKTRKTKTPARAKTPHAPHRSSMAAQKKAAEARNARDSTLNTNNLPDIESMVEGVDEVEARRITDSCWEPPELACFAKKMKSVSRSGGEKDKAEARRIADIVQEPEELPLSAKKAKPLPTPAREVPKAFSNDFEKSRFSTFSTSKRGSLNKKLHPEHDHGGRQMERPEDELTNKLTSLFFEDTTHSPQPGTHKLKEQEKKQKEREEQAKVEAEQARRIRRLTRQNPLRPLVAPLSSTWENAVSDLDCVDRVQEVVKGHKGTPLAGKDFRTLLGATSWLNDEIINAYLEWIVAAANAVAKAEVEKYGEPASTIPNFIAQNSFFHNTLTDKGPQATTRMMKRLGAPGTDFIHVDSMLVPICRNNHWTIGVVRPVAKTIEYFDSMGNPARRAEFGRLMRTWLKHQLGALYKAEEWSEPETKCAKQNNGWDCGVFVCTNALCIAYGIHTTCYLEEDMYQQRRNIAAVLLNRGFVKDFDWTEAGLLA